MGGAQYTEGPRSEMAQATSQIANPLTELQFPELQEANRERMKALSLVIIDLFQAQLAARPKDRR